MYPKILFTQNNISLFWEQLQWDWVELDLSDASYIHNKCNIADQEDLQNYANKIMQEKNTNWAISSFWEYRRSMFEALDARQMVEEGRFYHLWMDIWAPEGFSLFSPLEWEIIESWYEDGYGNYGGYVVVKYNFWEENLYVVFGHLNPETLIPQWTKVQVWKEIGKLWNMQQNGWYFYHTHVQVLTQEWYDSGFVSKGYADEETFHQIKKYVLDPSYFVFG